MRQHRIRTAKDAFRLSFSLGLSNFQLILPKSIRRTAVVVGGAFLEARPSFSQQIPKVICERSCRMAKTLTVKITLKEEKESGKTKKNRKKTVFLDDLYEKTLKKHTKSSGSSLFRRVTRWLRRMNKTGRKRRPIRLRCPA
jgi:hypothetical protein